MNGLAASYAVSDAWFSSMPGPTDPNRAFAFTGSALRELDNFQNDNQYLYWPYTPRRPSIWKVLWGNGFTDWKIYNSVEWQKFVHTYHLFLQGQIPSVDAHPKDHIGGINQFKKDARAGKLPAFSFLEPIWISLAGTSSYHPGGDLVPGERALNEIYDALKAGPSWNETLLIITFDEHGGLFDHVPPPYAENPWPNDVDNGFRYDLMGVRVPTILVSPWIEEHTVFRSPVAVPYDSTSILATLLQWYGIPKSRWGLGERTHHAPTFEGVFRRSTPRPEAPSFTPPYDRMFPREGGGGEAMHVHHLHRLMAPWLISALVDNKLSLQETARITDDILARAHDLKTLHSMIDDLAKKMA
jgi:phospholipase C